MKSVMLQESAFLKAYPAKKEVIKRTDDESIGFCCELSSGLLADSDNIIVEVWTNLYGRYHGFELKYDKDAAIKGMISYSLDLKIKTTGFFRATFRWKHNNNEYWNWLSSPYESDFSEIHVDPAYIKDSIVYNAFIRFFGQKELSKDGRIKLGEAGTFDDLKSRLDILKKMGISILYLNPIHPIGELYRNYNPHDQFPKYMQPGCPYSIKDYKAIDPEIGADTDHSQGVHASLSDPMIEFRDLVREAHKRGIKVFMDLVFNHTSHDFVLQRLHPEWFLYKKDIKNLEDPFIYPDEIKKGLPWGDPAHTFCPFDHGYWWEDAAQLNWEYMIPQAANRAPKNPTIREMYEYFKSIPKYWIKHLGIDGFRCDVAYRVPPRFWKECIRESRELAKREKQQNPKNRSLSGDVVFIAESYVDDVDELFNEGFTSVYGDYSNKLYNVQTLKGYLDYIYNISGKFFPEGSRFFIFPECHDFHRNTKKLLGQLSNDKSLSERANKSRWAITATLPGIPMIFNGFEKLEWKPINLFSYSNIDWESDKDLKRYIAKINAIRNSHTALQDGKYSYVETVQGITEHSQLFSFLRKNKDETLLICVNMDLHKKADMVKIMLPEETGIDFTRKYLLKDLLNHKEYIREGNEIFIILEPGESHIFTIMQ
jgi:glycosidase